MDLLLIFDITQPVYIILTCFYIIENCPSYRNILRFNPNNGPIDLVYEPISVGNSYRMGTFPLYQILFDTPDQVSKTHFIK